MRTIVMIVLMTLVIVIPATVIAILVIRLERTGSRMNSAVQTAPIAPPTVTVTTNAATSPAYFGYWWMELINLETGVRSYRAFCDRIILGRTMPMAEELGRWYVSEHPTVSRDQCLVALSGNAAWLENLSRVNVTGLNGYAVQVPTVLHTGDYLQLGAETYAVTKIGPCA